MGKGSSSTPDVPDYIGAAKATSQGNLDLAKYATQANRVNQVTPYGSLTWTNGKTFDQAGYDAAMAAYRSGLANQNTGGGGSGSAGGHWESRPDTSYGDPNATYNNVWVPNVMNNQGVAKNSGGMASGGGGSGAAMPNAQDYYSGADNWTQTVKLSPEMQALFDQQMKLSQGLAGAQDSALGRVNQMMGTGFDMSSLPGGGQALNMGNLPGMGQALDMNSLPGAGAVYDPNLATNTATDAILSRVNPELDRQYESLRNQLANQGIAQGSAAWNNAMSSFGQQRNDAVTQAGLQGINLGMQQQGLTYNQQTQNRAMAAALQGQQFAQQNGLRTQEAGLQNQQFSQANQARQQALQEQAFLRNLPLNELNALRSGSQVQMPEFPGYSQQATTSGPDYTGAAQNTYQSQLGASNAQNAGNSNMMSGLFGLGQLGMMGYGMGMFSDRRLKRNIKRLATSIKGLGIYSFDYIFGGSMIGYMADEVERVSPGAVREIGGLKIVNYAEV
ncbi:tail fiber domain-containing protein [Achromobacter xylosoxidans]|uniref:Peptidase S74 domain-containing protein n=1 Tax=Alcaligenes xylosoxydans xylosoxydans TaxID=85698 RepID=A0A424W5F5_ALCXX|nr:tail fiber domain-containing protein [Achromobacter xylosoxidans]MBC9904761.1 tail fiber domain-containing protein [Achromobacter xylosoxidans]MBD0868678.1 tail fiber domain-containing protein [Achromobacter xylosoxidans]QNP87819.1 tail fiber domain-containing protein [Achromobacter xylosoxidans]RPJ88408.1 hypothetical protein DY367_27770 [Achromobacter xylosoxidans]